MRPRENDSRSCSTSTRRGLPGREAHAPLRRRRGGRPGDRRRRRRRRGRSPSGWRGAAGRIVILEAGPFWDPGRGLGLRRGGLAPAVLDRAARDRRRDPVELGKNNSGRGVGGSMVHYAGYAPRFHPSDFETAQPRRRRRRLADRLRGPEAPLRAGRARAAGRRAATGRGATRTATRTRRTRSPAPRARAGRAPARLGIEMRVGPVGDRQRRVRQPAALHLPWLLPAGLQGQRQGLARWSPTCRTRSSTASRSAPIAWRPRVEIDDAPAAATGVRYFHEGRRERFQRARRRRRRRLLDRDARGCCCTRRAARFPNGLANNDDQVGRYVMVQGAPQVAGRFPEQVRMYKAPPPEISSEQFYETDARRGFARGFSIQTVGAAADRLGRARARRRPLGPRPARVHARLQPLVHARRAVRAAAARREPRDARRRARTATGCRWPGWTTRQCENDRANIAYRQADAHRHPAGGRRPGRADHRPLRPPRRRVPDGRDSPETSVVDADHRVWEMPNLFVADGSVMPDAGLGQPGADDHGPGLASGRPARRQARREGWGAAAGPARGRDGGPVGSLTAPAVGGFGARSRGQLTTAGVEANAARPVRQNTKAPLFLQGFYACAREDSNLHGLFAHKALNLARLPIPPQAQRRRSIAGHLGPSGLRACVRRMAALLYEHMFVSGAVYPNGAHRAWT